MYRSIHDADNQSASPLSTNGYDATDFSDIDFVIEEPEAEFEPGPRVPSAAETAAKAAREQIAVIGLAGRFPGAPTIDHFWQNLANGVEARTHFTDDELRPYLAPEVLADPNYVKSGFVLKDIEWFDADFFGFTKRQAQLTDPQQRLFLECAWEALECAGIAPHDYPGLIGVYAGASLSSYWDMARAFRTGLSVNALLELIGNDKDYIATQTAYRLNLQGPCMTVQTACSTGLVAVHVGCQSLLNRECDVVLAGGVTVHVPHRVGYLYEDGSITSPDGSCHAFDAEARGTVFGNGVGIVVLKRLSEALADGDPIWAVIKGSAVNNDGSRKFGFTTSSALGQFEVISEAWDVAEVTADTISYIETHGTGTQVGDPIEVATLAELFAAHDVDSRTLHHRCAIGSVKTNVGHLESAAGIAGLIKTVLALHHQQIPPSINYHQPNPEIDFANIPLYVNTRLTPWPIGATPRRAGVSSFGIGGTNAHIVLEEAPAQAPQPANRSRQILTLSAKSMPALRDLAARYATYLADADPALLPDICYTSQMGRRHFAQRLALSGTTPQELQERLSAFAQGRAAASVYCGEVSEDQPRPRLAFLFTGQGAQYRDMGRDLYASQPIFRAIIDRCEVVMQARLGRSLLELIYPSMPPTHNDLLESHPCGQAANFALECALVELWRSWGVTPDLVLGHSLGDFAAAYCAGVFSLEEGLQLVIKRGQLMETAQGAMVSALASEATVLPLLAGYDQVALGVINGPQNVVISGAHEAIAAITQQLNAQGIKTKRLDIPVAAHSPLLEPVLDEFAASVGQTTRNLPQLPVVSSMSGQLVSSELTDPAYWRQHLRNPVRFADGVQTLLDQGCTLMVEIGPKPTLLGLAQQVIEQDADEEEPETTDERARTPHVLLLPSLRTNAVGGDWQTMLDCLGQLYVQGCTLDWAAVARATTRRKVVLPTYPFQRQRYWLDEQAISPTVLTPPVAPNEPTSELVRQLTHGQTAQLQERLASSGRLSPQEQALLPKLLTLLAEQHRQEMTVNTLSDWLYEVNWQPAPLSDPSTALALSGSWLIFVDQTGVGAALATQLRALGARVICVERGAVYQLVAEDTFALPADDAPSYQQLLASVGTLQGIIHLWSLDISALPAITNESRPDDLATEQDLDADLQVACASTLYLLQALVQSQSELKGLWLVTGQAQTIGVADTSAGLWQTPLWGMGRVIALEHPEFNCIRVDIGEVNATGAQALLAEICAAWVDPSHEDEIAWRHGQRYVARLVRWSAPPVPITPVKIGDGATYLITGGLGGLGLLLAEWLVQQGARHLLLLGRRPPTAAAQARLAGLTAQGVTIHIVQADVTQLGQLTTALAQIDDRYPLKGIIHAAGVLDDGALFQQSWARFWPVMAPKLLGAWHLHRLSETLPLDFFVLFSSLTSLLGNRGQANYAAGNTFLDALAHYRRARQLPALSINWGAWAEQGLAAELIKQQTQSLRLAQGYDVIEPTQGLAALTHLLTHNASQVGVIPIDWTIFLQRAAGDRAFFANFVAAASDATAKIPTTDKLEQTTPTSLRQQLSSASPEEQRTVLLMQVQTLLGKILGQSAATEDQSALGQSAASQPLMTLGLDSLMAIELRNQVRKLWGVRIEFAQILEGLSIVGLVELLLSELSHDNQAIDNHMSHPLSIELGLVNASEDKEESWISGTL